MKKQNPKYEHWLLHPKTIKPAWIGYVMLLIVTVLSDFLVKHKAYFEVDGSFGFGAWFGLCSCLILVCLAKLVGFCLKRPETYYDQ